MTARTILSELMTRDCTSLDEHTALDSIHGFDSMAMVNLVLRLERTLARELTEGEMERLRTLRDVDVLLGTRR